MHVTLPLSSGRTMRRIVKTKTGRVREAGGRDVPKRKPDEVTRSVENQKTREGTFWSVVRQLSIVGLLGGGEGLSL